MNTPLMGMVSCGPCAAFARFRVWITRYRDWRPEDCRAVPPHAVAIEPAEAGTMSAKAATAYAAAFNREAMAHPGNLWAMVVPVAVRYEGEPQRGEEVGRMKDEG